MTATTPPNSVHPATRAEWRAWLEQNHTRPDGVWLISFKKATGKPCVEYDEAVEEALCFGWVDSKPNKLDDERSMLWFAPRKPQTGWSKPNKDRVARLCYRCGQRQRLPARPLLRQILPFHHRLISV